LSFYIFSKKKLKKNNYKITKTRREVIKYIENKCHFFSANVLIKELDQLDRVSIYRTLDLLENLDLIHTVTQKDGRKFYELHEKNEHHHHIVCKECSKYECIPCGGLDIELKDFEKIHHSIYITGVCSNCK